MQMTISAVRGKKKTPGAMSGEMPKGKMMRFSAERADNGGFTVTSHHEAPKSKKPKGMGMNMGMGMEAPTEMHQAVFPDHKKALKHIGAMMAPPEAAAPAGGPPAPEGEPAPEGNTPAPGAAAAAEPDGDEE
jgi:hypothetical protein